MVVLAEPSASQVNETASWPGSSSPLIGGVVMVGSSEGTESKEGSFNISSSSDKHMHSIYTILALDFIHDACIPCLHLMWGWGKAYQ